MTFTPEMIVTLAVAFMGSAALSSWVTAWALRRKVAADATQIIGTAWQDVVSVMEARIKTTEAHVATLESARASDRAAYDQLWERVRKLEEDNYRLSEELKTERALTKRQREKIGFLEDRLLALEPGGTVQTE